MFRSYRPESHRHAPIIAHSQRACAFFSAPSTSHITSMATYRRSSQSSRHSYQPAYSLNDTPYNTPSPYSSSPYNSPYNSSSPYNSTPPYTPISPTSPYESANWPPVPPRARRPSYTSYRPTRTPAYESDAYSSGSTRVDRVDLRDRGRSWESGSDRRSTASREYTRRRSRRRSSPSIDAHGDDDLPDPKYCMCCVPSGCSFKPTSLSSVLSTI